MKPSHQGKMLPIYIGVAAFISAVALLGIYGGLMWADGDERPMGWVANQAESERFNSTLKVRAKAKIGADLIEEALPKNVLGWRALEEASQKKFGRPYSIEAQTIGDCVSHGTARAISCVFAVDYLSGARTDWLPVASEAVYAGRAEIGRGSMSDGWYGSASAKYIRDRGILFRTKYTGPGGEVVDLSTYSGNRAKQWGYYGLGGASGNHWLEAEAAKFKVPEVALIQSTQELQAAIANGYFGFICSGVGFEPTQRDANGICKAGGDWPHCMSVLGYFTLEREGVIFVIFNSWGPKGTSGPGGQYQIPTGAFGCRERDMRKILSQRDSYVCSGPNGFERRDIDHDTWAILAPGGDNYVIRDASELGGQIKSADEFFTLAP